MATTLLTQDTCPVPFTVEYHTRGRKISMRFHPLKRMFVVRCPKGSSHRTVHAFVKKYASSMEGYVSALPEAVPLQYGSIIPILGELHVLSRVQEATLSDMPHLVIPATARTCHRLIVSTLRTILKDYIDGRIDMLLAKPVFAALNAPPTICLRDPVSRYGSCSSDGKLMFSWRLVFAPLHVIDYVVAHECAHLLHHDHSAAFWQTTRALHPDISIAKTWLKQYYSLLFSYR